VSKFLIAYAKLLSMKEGLPDSRSIGSYYVDEYHKILDSFKESLGEDIEDFRVNDAEIKPIITSGNYRTGETRYSSEKYVDREKLLINIDGLLNYLTLQSNDEDKKKIIGFRTEAKG
jgi:hypothetical protein